jgi:hypothetical protein
MSLLDMPAGFIVMIAWIRSAAMRSSSTSSAANSSPTARAGGPASGISSRRRCSARNASMSAAEMSPGRAPDRCP